MQTQQRGHFDASSRVDCTNNFLTVVCSVFGCVPSPTNLLPQGRSKPRILIVVLPTDTEEPIPRC